MSLFAMRLLDLGVGADVMGSAQTPRTPPTLIHPSTEPAPPADSGQRCLKRRAAVRRGRRPAGGCELCQILASPFAARLLATTPSPMPRGHETTRNASSSNLLSPGTLARSTSYDDLLRIALATPWTSRAENAAKSLMRRHVRSRSLRHPSDLRDIS